MQKSAVLFQPKHWGQVDQFNLTDFLHALVLAVTDLESNLVDSI